MQINAKGILLALTGQEISTSIDTLLLRKTKLKHDIMNVQKRRFSFVLPNVNQFKIRFKRSIAPLL